MTLSPVEQVRIGVPPQEGWVEGHPELLCCCPSCGKVGTQTHHVITRKFTLGAKRWVTVDGLVLLNERRVCLWCHDDINNHLAWIMYAEGEGWVWYVARSPLPHETAFQHPKSGRWFVLVGPLKEIR